MLEVLEMLDIEDIMYMLSNSSELQYMLEEVLSLVKGVVAPFLILPLLLGVANCFFGYKIYRVLLAISTGLVGGVIGIVLGLACTDMHVAGAVVGFFLGAALFGMLAYFLYKVFIFIQAFFTGFALGFVVGILVVQLETLTIGLILGVVLGIALGVLAIIFERILITALTSYKGATAIALVLSLLIVQKPANFMLWNGILTAVFTIGGFLFQFFVKIGKTQNAPVRVNQPMMAPPMNQGMTPPMNQAMAPSMAPPMNQQMVPPVNQAVMPQAVKTPTFLGVEGLYRGFEFDLTRNFVFGRDEEKCNILYPEKSNGISKVQFEVGISNTNGQVYVMDPGSSYGTNVNGQRIENNKAVFLKDGDMVMFGEGNVFKVSYQ